MPDAAAAPEHTYSPSHPPDPTRACNLNHTPDPRPARTLDVDILLPPPISLKPDRPSTGHTHTVFDVATAVLAPERVSCPSHARAPIQSHTIEGTASLAPRGIPAPAPSPVPVLSDTNEKIFDGYLSDLEDVAFVLEEDNLDDWYDECHTTCESPTPTSATHKPPVTEHSALKRRRLDVPLKEQCEDG
ncbi:hypothetical protein EDB89DRAFT_2076021 [Lactarius sanguifluus]|nr:hypothetical protein EDB89DRAFT_2076021 [Lactarius sanguifluus]